MKFFNTAGPIKPDIHYCLPPLSRLDKVEVLSFVAQQKYFVLHAPRQTGKTSCLLALQEYLNREGRYACVYCNVELAQSAREDVEAGLRAIIGQIASRAQQSLQDDFLLEQQQAVQNQAGEHGVLNRLLTVWAEHSPKPLVLLIDEIDALIGDTLIAVLRQLRAGYDQRPGRFPQSVILCGVRDVRDYRIHSSRTKEIVTGGSAFNIKSESLRLGNFTTEEVERLYRQHTAETGQVFEDGVFPLVWELTAGQPWLVNALAYQACFARKEMRERSRPVTVEVIHQAKEELIARRDTHLDQLADKLSEERVRRVIEPMLAGAGIEGNTDLSNEIQYVIDLGLIRRGQQGLEVSNAIYREIIPRELTAVTQLSLESTQRVVWYIAADGSLDMTKLLAAFQQFFREHSEHWVERFEYKEAGPQLLMQAFLQRIVNGGGRIEREYGLGRKRTDLLVLWPYSGGVQRAVIELKVGSGGSDALVNEGLEQTSGYMDRCGAGEGHLVIFDRNPARTWEEKIFQRAATHSGHAIHVWGM